MRIRKLQKKDILFLLVVLVLYTAGAALLFKRGLIICADSMGYLNYFSSQSPVYPLVIRICRLIAGSGYQTVLLSVQIVFGLTGITVFSVFLYRHFSLNKWLVLLFSLILFEPYFFALRIGNNMATESLAYPLFLITLKYLLEGLKYKNPGKIVWSFFFTSLLVLTRIQFVFLYPLQIIIILYLLFFTTTNKRLIFKLGMIFIAFVLGNYLFEKGYNYINGGTIDKAASGLQLATKLIYISTLQDSTLFSDKLEKGIFIDIIKDAEKYKLTRSSGTDATYLNQIMSYHPTHRIIMYNMQLHLKPEKSPDSLFTTKLYNYKYFQDSELMVRMGKVSNSMAMKLLIHHWKLFARLYIKSILQTLDYPIGSVRKIIIGIGLLIMFIIGKRSDELTVLLVVVICHLLNLCLVATVEVFVTRYFFYTEILVFVIFISVLFSYLGKGAHETSPLIPSPALKG